MLYFIAITTSAAAIASILHSISLQITFLVISGLATGYNLARKKPAALDSLVVWLALAGLSFTDLETSEQYSHVFLMAVGLTASVMLPLSLYKKYSSKPLYTISRRLFADILDNKPLMSSIIFIITTCCISLGYYFFTTNSHESWPMNTPYQVFIVFVCIMCIGICEEFFFIAMLLGIYRKHFPFYVANLIQSLPFAMFLYAFGFRGWIVGLTIVYALCQGWLYTKYKNLAANIIVHLVVDLMVFGFIFASKSLDMMG